MVKRFAALVMLALCGAANATAPQGLFTLAGSQVDPVTGGIAAANATAGTNISGTYTAGNALCDVMTPYYWVIGDKDGPISAGAVYKNGQTPVLASTPESIASASKMAYAGYIAQLRDADGGLTPTDVDYLHFTSGHTNMGGGSGDGTGSQCPPGLLPFRGVTSCLAQTQTIAGPGFGQLFDWLNPADVGHFHYDSGHMEVHARDFANLGGLNGTIAALNTAIVGTIMAGSAAQYSQPLLAGGLYLSANDYSVFLMAVVNGAPFLDYLGTYEVCANPGQDYSTQLVNGVAGPHTCDSTYSPITQERWKYSMGHWVESDPATNGDGAYCSPGSFGFTPCITHDKQMWSVLSRKGNPGQGYDGARCERLIRTAYILGCRQNGTFPATSC